MSTGVPRPILQTSPSRAARIAEGAPALWQAANVVFEDAVRCGWMKPAPA